MGMEGNGKPPQCEWELPALPREVIPTDFLNPDSTSSLLFLHSNMKQRRDTDLSD